MKKSQFLTDGPKDSKKVIILAHGAGAPMDSEWMNNITKELVKNKIRVIRFEFPYMIERRENGTKRPPNTMKILQETWKEVILKVGNSNEIFIGGKSMGGRVASLIADDSKIKGLVCLGFPFHAPGKDPKDRIIHLEKLKTKTIILQGERDSMGTKEDIATYILSKKIKLSFFEDGDHGLKPRKKSGFTLTEYIEQAAQQISNFMEK